MTLSGALRITSAFAEAGMKGRPSIGTALTTGAERLWLAAGGFHAGDTAPAPDGGARTSLPSTTTVGWNDDGPGTWLLCPSAERLAEGLAALAGGKAPRDGTVALWERPLLPKLPNDGAALPKWAMSSSLYRIRMALRTLDTAAMPITLKMKSRATTTRWPATVNLQTTLPFWISALGVKVVQAVPWPSNVPKVTRSQMADTNKTYQYAVRWLSMWYNTPTPAAMMLIMEAVHKVP